MSSLIINLDDLYQLRQNYRKTKGYGKVEPIRCEAIAQIVEIEFTDIVNESFEDIYRCVMRIRNVPTMNVISKLKNPDLGITITVDGKVYESLYHQRGENCGKGDMCQFSLVLWNPMEGDEETPGIWEAVDISPLTLNDVEYTCKFLSSDFGQQFLETHTP